MRSRELSLDFWHKDLLSFCIKTDPFGAVSEFEISSHSFKYSLQLYENGNWMLTLSHSASSGSSEPSTDIEIWESIILISSWPPDVIVFAAPVRTSKCCSNDISETACGNMVNRSVNSDVGLDSDSSAKQLSSLDIKLGLDFCSLYISSAASLYLCESQDLLGASHFAENLAFEHTGISSSNSPDPCREMIEDGCVD